MIRFFLVLPVLLLLSCGHMCEQVSPPQVFEVPGGLREPISCSQAAGQRCCSWVFEGCIHTFCTVGQDCEWQYKSGYPLMGIGECRVPEGHVEQQVILPDWRMRGGE